MGGARGFGGQGGLAGLPGNQPISGFMGGGRFGGGPSGIADRMMPGGNMGGQRDLGGGLPGPSPDFGGGMSRPPMGDPMQPGPTMMPPTAQPPSPQGPGAWVDAGYGSGPLNAQGQQWQAAPPSQPSAPLPPAPAPTAQPPAMSPPATSPAGGMGPMPPTQQGGRQRMRGGQPFAVPSRRKPQMGGA